MTVTTSQVFQIGAIVLGAITAILGFLHVGDPTVVAGIGGVIVSAWGSIGTILTGQAAQLKEVASYPGVTSIQTNQNANATVRAVAEDDSQAAAKVLPPK